MKILTYLSLIFTILLTNSCATIVSTSRQNVVFRSNPSKANIFINEVKVGKTPFQIKLERKKEYDIRIELEGYKPYETRLTKEFNAWYLGNILFGGLIGLIIDPITGAIYRLSPEQINAQLGQSTASIQSKNGVYIAVSLEVDEKWDKIGNLEKD